MNRLVIIGNGFDLAHGLPTSYKDFIDDYVNNVIKTLKENYFYEDDFYKISLDLKEPLSPFDNRHINSFRCIDDVGKYISSKLKFSSEYSEKFKIKNAFFNNLCHLNYTQNWVDIENIYYKDLLKILEPNTIPDINGLGIIQEKYTINKLNKEFENVKNLLEKYLNEKVINRYLFDVHKDINDKKKTIYETLRPISLFNNESTILHQFTKKEDINELINFFDEEKKDYELVNYKLLFLNFNYTPTIDLIYKGLLNNQTSVYINNIHGEIGNNKENKINFGFGDEMDDDYKMIENIGDNEYLRNFKSFQYLQNSNYNNLLSFINSENFQLIIVGHSCGLSDRTLLNTIFEHENCRSIKVFYHQKEDGTDNFTEIIQNISRHFNDKKLMREKIVNKTLCQPLLQMQLSKKENSPQS